ncbi:MAG TPA: hypothetical protein DDZ51_22650, partial [Planctomycetaceae bacterium]|nr:hypothetical protein [Planctomycetaceae bacterium]
MVVVNPMNYLRFAIVGMVCKLKRLIIGILQWVARENLLALFFVATIGSYIGLYAQSKLTRACALSSFSSSLDVASKQPARFTETKINDAFALRWETKGAAMKLPHASTESISGGNESLLCRGWIYKGANGTLGTESESLRAQDILAVCEIVRTGVGPNYDVRVRFGVEHEDRIWRWIDIGAGDVDSRLLDVRYDRFSPLMLAKYLVTSFFGSAPSTLATSFPADYLTTSRPTNASAIEICLDSLAEKLPEINSGLEDVISGNGDAFREIMNEVSSRIYQFDATLQSDPALFVVSAAGGACQAVAFAATGIAALFLLLQAVGLMVNREGRIGGDFVDELLAKIRLSGLVGTLVYLGAA